MLAQSFARGSPYIKKDLQRMKARWLREIGLDFLDTPGGEKFARLLLFRAIMECPSDLRSVKHLLRSFVSFAAGTRRYKNQEVYEDEIPSEITEEFLRNLFNGKHHCRFCEFQEKL